MTDNTDQQPMDMAFLPVRSYSMLYRAQFLEDAKRMVFHSLAAASQLVSALVEKPAKASILLVSSFTQRSSLGCLVQRSEVSSFEGSSPHPRPFASR